MPNPLPVKRQKLIINMQRDECPVIARSGDPVKLKKNLSALSRILKTMPQSKDPAPALRRARSQRGLV